MIKGGFHMDTPVHDPMAYTDGETYYIFGSHMSAATSKDLRHWQQFAEGVNEENPLFSNLFLPEAGAFDYAGENDGTYSVWAPDVSYNPYLGKYVMYFCTTSSFMKSCLCMAVADEVKGPYTYTDTILYSGFNRDTYRKTNIEDILGENPDLTPYLNADGVYDHLKWPNCIDPNTFHDKEGRFWMVYGSWSGGIFLLELDEHTGRPIHPEADPKNQVDEYFGRKLMGGGHKSIEGPYILYDRISDYYYLFVSFGWLEREGGYQVRLFRSKKPEGPYVDMLGNSLFDEEEHAPFGLKLIGNYVFPSLDMGYKSPGHNSAFEDRDKKLYMVYHQRFDMQWEIHEPRVHQLFRTKDQWLTLCPFATEGEVLAAKKYRKEELAGRYYLVDHLQDISSEVHVPVMIELTEQGEIFRILEESEGELQKKTASAAAGDYRPGDSSGITFTIDGNSYEGVVVEMKDEAGNQTRCITAVGSNHSLWAVRYL